MARSVVILAAHGSHVSPASGEPARQHMAALRRRAAYAQVEAVFWKEFPSFRDLPYLVEPDLAPGDQVFVVPFFMAEGYFTERVLPRELDLPEAVNERRGVLWHRTPPVGVHPRLSAVIAHRVEEALAPDGPPREQVAVVVTGHGTVQHRRSGATVRDHADTLAATGCYASVTPAYMEEPPRLDQVADELAAEAIVVVPLFAADGLHSDEDVPELLGLQRTADGQWRQPSRVRGKRLWYTSAVGSDPVMVEVIEALIAGARESTPSDTVTADAV